MSHSTASHTAPLGAILALITGKLVAPLDDLYDLQDFIVGRALMTHERTTGWDRQCAALLEQFPQLAEAVAPDFSDVAPADREAACRAWVDSVAEHIGWSSAEVKRTPGCEVDPGEALDRILVGRAGA